MRLLLYLLLTVGLPVNLFAIESSQTDSTWNVNIRQGDSLRQAGNVQQALFHYFDALRQSEGDPNEWHQAVASHKLASLYEQYYRYRETIPYFKKAYSVYKKRDSVSFLATAANSIAWNYIKINEIDSAVRYAEESVKLYEILKPKDPISYCAALESLGEIYSSKKRYADADRVLQRSMELGVETNNVIIQGFTNYGIALNHFNQKENNKALVHINLCLPVAEKYATEELMVLVYKLAYEIHNAAQLRSTAFTYLEKYSKLKDKLHSEDIEKKAAIINANYEIQKKEDDLRILSQTNAIQQLEIQRQTIIQNSTIAGVIVLVIISVLVYSRIQSKRKFEHKELERKREEMEQARKVQLSLLPKKPLIEDTFEVFGKMMTATEVGGDYFDFIKLDQNRILIAFGDATGHGMTAGMMVTITKVALINNLGLLKDSNDVVPLARVINDSILASISVKGIGMALQLCVMDAAKQSISMTSCGMPYAMTYHKPDQHLTTIEIKQPPLGFFKTSKIELFEISFTKNHILFFISDGILERFNKAKEEYGFDRMARVLKSELPNADLPTVLDKIFADADVFSAGLPNHDDMTALVARLK